MSDSRSQVSSFRDLWTPDGSLVLSESCPARQIGRPGADVEQHALDPGQCLCLLSSAHRTASVRCPLGRCVGGEEGLYAHWEGVPRPPQAASDLPVWRLASNSVADRALPSRAAGVAAVVGHAPGAALGRPRCTARPSPRHRRRRARVVALFHARAAASAVGGRQSVCARRLSTGRVTQIRRASRRAAAARRRRRRRRWRQLQRRPGE